MWGAYFFGGFLRWLLRGFKTKLDDEISCEDGWFHKIPIINRIPLIDEYENIILAQFFVLLLIAFLFILGVL